MARIPTCVRADFDTAPETGDPCDADPRRMRGVVTVTERGEDS